MPRFPFFLLSAACALVNAGEAGFERAPGALGTDGKAVLFVDVATNAPSGAPARHRSLKLFRSRYSPEEYQALREAREAEERFGADYAYVQPHSGADTNLVAYWAILSAKVETPTLEELGVKSLNDLTEEQFNELRKRFGNQKLMGLDYPCGGHLTHGYKMNVSARMFESHPYGVDEKTGLLDYDAIEKQAMEVKIF